MSVAGAPALANVSGRATLVWEGGHSDVGERSSGRFGPAPEDLFDRWETFWDWARRQEPESDGHPFAAPPGEIGPPVPRPRQVFAIGLNYRDHATEAGYDTAGLPQVFTKFPSCIVGPYATVAASGPRMDWEVELVLVIGREARRTAEAAAWDHVAGVMVGQDLSARDVQLAGQSPQWSLGKSFPGFGPTGPYLVPEANLASRDDLPISCSLNGETVQQARTSELIWSVSELISRISSVCTLLPGDLIFTGTPAGVGNRRVPPRYLAPGDRLVSAVGGVGEIVTDIVAADAA